MMITNERSCEVCGETNASVRYKDFEHGTRTSFQLLLCGWCMAMLCSKEDGGR